MAQIGIKSGLVRASAPSLGAITGLIMPAPQGSTSGIVDGTSFSLLGSNCPTHLPLTIIFKVKYSLHNYYYTNFFWCGNHGGSYFAETGFIGCHPYPNPAPNGSDHKWEVSTNFFDTLSADSVTYGTWHTQAVTVTGTSFKPIITYYPHLQSDTATVTYDYNDHSESFAVGAVPGLIFGDLPWTDADTSEAMDATFRGIQVYQAVHSLANIQAAAALDYDSQVLSLGLSNLHYLNMNPTPTDISDKSLAGHNPVWNNSNRPTLWTGP